MSSQDAAVRHQAVVPDKVPTGEYPVSQLGPKSVRTGWTWLMHCSSSTMTRTLPLRSRPDASTNVYEKTLQARDAVYPPLRLGLRCSIGFSQSRLDAVLGEGLPLLRWKGRIRASHAVERSCWCDWMLPVRLLEVLQYVQPSSHVKWLL